MYHTPYLNQEYIVPKPRTMYPSHFEQMRREQPRDIYDVSIDDVPPKTYGFSPSNENNNNESTTKSTVDYDKKIEQIWYMLIFVIILLSIIVAMLFINVVFRHKQIG